MKRNRSSVTQAVLNPLRSAWEDTVADGLRQATDVELLWMLDEIEAQLGERAVPWDRGRPAGDERAPAADDIPDWDDKSPEELEAIIRQLEAETAAAGAEPSFHKPEKPHGLHRGRPLNTAERHAARLRCEELEPRYPPTTFVVVLLQPTPAVALVSTWNAQEAVAPSCHAQGSAFSASGSALVWNEDVADNLAQALVA